MLSYWHTPNPQPLEWLTIPQLIDQWAEKKPDDEAYVVRMKGAPREAVTFKQLRQKTEALAAGLLKLGLRPGDFVLITGITCLNWILTDLACASVGITTVRGRMSVLTKEGLLTIANRNNIKAIFFHPGKNGEFYTHLKKCIPDAFDQNPVKDKLCKEIPCLEIVIALAPCEDVRVISDIFNENGDLCEVQALKTKVSSDNIASVFMTSGSTGFPKATPNTHFMLCNLTKHTPIFRCTVKDDDRMFNDRTLSSLGSFATLPLIYGSCNVFVHLLTNSSDTDIDFCIQVFHEERINCGTLLQYLITDIVHQFESGKAKRFHLRWAGTGGEVLQAKILQSLARFADKVVTAYGSTECGFISSDLGNDIEKSIKYAGFVDPGIEVKIVDEDGQIVPMGKSGEIFIRSPFAFRGYLQEESKGMAISKEGWIGTDDAGCLEEGYLKVFGRKSHVISRGTLLTYPIVVERMIAQFPGVSKVAVIGVPDKHLGENICACIIPTEGTTLTSDDMLRCFDDLYKTDEGLGMTPAYFMFLNEFPTLNEKVDRKNMKKMAIQEFGI